MGLIVGLCWLAVCLVLGIRLEHSVGFPVAALVAVIAAVVGMAAIAALLRRRP